MQAVSERVPPPPSLTREQKAAIEKLHVNISHPNVTQFLRVLKAAGAKPEILNYVAKEFRCAQCDVRRAPVSRRRAAIPPTFAFNKSSTHNTHD